MVKLSRKQLQLKADDLDKALAAVRPVCTMAYRSTLDATDAFAFQVHINRVAAGTLGSMENKPEPRIDDRGVSYVPGCIRIECEEGNIDIVAEDCKILPGLSSVLLDLGSGGTVEFKK